MPENNPQSGEYWSPRELVQVVGVVSHLGVAQVHLLSSANAPVYMDLDRFVALYDYYPSEGPLAQHARMMRGIVPLPEVVEQAVQQTLGRLSPARLETVRRIIRERLEAQRIAREARPMAHRVTSHDQTDYDTIQEERFTSPPVPEELDGYTPEEVEALAARDEDAQRMVESFHRFREERFASRNPAIPDELDGYTDEILLRKRLAAPPPTQWDRLTRDEDE
jgi:hypothetical protein